MTEAAGEPLLQRRRDIEAQWRRFRNGQPLLRGSAVRDDIVSSWRRSTGYNASYQLSAPGDDPREARAMWKASLLCRAAGQSRDSIMQLAREGELVAAIADPAGRLIWTFASQRMSDSAEAVNLTLGSRWDERAVGTNAIGLSLQLQRPATVFSSEHFQPFVHDWVSYAAPILYPRSGECAGILSLSTAWNRHTPLGQAAVTQLAQTIAEGLPCNRPKAELEIHALGQPRVMFRGEPLRLPLRQIEILCLLALNARGLNLEAFHAALYGDAPVSSATLKAELSHLRRLLDRQIGSRPYRLQVPVWADFIEIWQALRRKKTGEAFSLYRGTLLPQSQSPELEEWRRCIDAVMSQALGSVRDPVLLMDKLCHGSSGSELVRERLDELMSR
ncbi:MAG: transcriptional regulator [Candidatus Thiodiazotropha sp.]